MCPHEKPFTLEKHAGRAVAARRVAGQDEPHAPAHRGAPQGSAEQRRHVSLADRVEKDDPKSGSDETLVDRNFFFSPFCLFFLILFLLFFVLFFLQFSWKNATLKFHSNESQAHDLSGVRYDQPHRERAPSLCFYPSLFSTLFPTRDGILPLSRVLPLRRCARSTRRSSRRRKGTAHSRHNSVGFWRVGETGVWAFWTMESVLESRGPRECVGRLVQIGYWKRSSCESRNANRYCGVAGTASSSASCPLSSRFRNPRVRERATVPETPRVGTRAWFLTRCVCVSRGSSGAQPRSTRASLHSQTGATRDETIPFFCESILVPLGISLRKTRRSRGS